MEVVYPRVSCGWPKANVPALLYRSFDLQSGELPGLSLESCLAVLSRSVAHGHRHEGCRTEISEDDLAQPLAYTSQP